jgi:hypothetical protein
LKRLGFRSRNFLAQLLSETSRAGTIRVRQSSLGRLWNDLGSHACLHRRNRRPGTFAEERISGEFWGRPRVTRKPSGLWCGWRRKIPCGAISGVFLRTFVARRFGGAEHNSSSAQRVRGFSRGTISRVGASDCRSRFGNGARTLRIYFSSSQAGDGRGPRPRPGRILPLLDKSPRRENREA